MKDDKKLDAVLERFYNTYNRYNTKVLEELGNTIRQFDGLSPSEAHKLAQELKYSNNVDELLEELSRISGKSVKDINVLLDEVAKENVGFADAYIESKERLSYEDDVRLKRYVETIKKETNSTFKDLTKQKNIGFTIKDKANNVVEFKPLKKVYSDLIDEAVFNVSTGVVDYQSAMRSTLKQLANSGVKIHEATTTYESGYNRRIDSSVRQAVLTGIRRTNIGVQEMVGEELGADGVEISAHSPCAEDHLDVQGKQFSKKEFKKINGTLDRPIGDLNCRHFVFSIILGVNLPSYSKKQLDEMRMQSTQKVSYKGKTYTRYEATQVQRKLETAVRKQKDNQIIAKASGDNEGVEKAQKKITQLTKEYKEFSDATGLDVYMDRMRVSGYRRTKIEGNISPKSKINASKLIVEQSSKQKKFDFVEEQAKLVRKNIIVDEKINGLNEKLVERNIKQLEKLNDKYNVADQQYLKLEQKYNNNSAIATTYYAENRIELNSKYFKSNKLIEIEKSSQKIGWHNKINSQDLDLYTITHEFGHAVENNYARKYIKRVYGIDTAKRRNSYAYKEKEIRIEIDKDIRNSIFKEIQNKEKLSTTEIKNKYFSKYANSKRNFEWFAETFTQMELGKENNMTKAMKEWLERNY